MASKPVRFSEASSSNLASTTGGAAALSPGSMPFSQNNIRHHIRP
jgi:hypothetical protein